MEVTEESLAYECACWAAALLRIDRPTGRLLLHLENRTLDGATRDRQFVNGLFEMKIPFILPPRIVEVLGFTAANYRIAAGRYPTLDDGEFTTLSLRLAENTTVSLPGLRAAA